MGVRVLVISDYGWVTGGTEEFVNALLVSAGRRHQVELLTWADSRAPRPSSAEVVGVESGDVLAVWSAVARADVVVVVTSFNMRLLARAAVEILARDSTPVVTILQTSAHSSPASLAARRQRAWLVELISASEVVVGVSDAVMDGLQELADEMTDPPPLVLIENGARLLDRTVKGRGRRRVLYIGRPTDSKGYPSFLKLVGELRGRDLEFLANTVSVPPSVTDPDIQYSRCLSDGELLALFAEVDLVVAPYWRADGLPLALLEAINCGVPVIGFDSPAVGPLLRSHRQPVVDCDSGALVRVVRAWSRGRLPIEAPRPGGVPALLDQAERHVDLITAASLGVRPRSIFCSQDHQRPLTPKDASSGTIPRTVETHGLEHESGHEDRRSPADSSQVQFRQNRRKLSSK
jgi:glycosyltransferase involved in cell wall biosynthesis